MIAEVLAVGSELLLGQIANTNAATISEALTGAGDEVCWHSVVGDDLPRVAAAISLALARAGVLVICGGLGPTHDDLTREGIAAATGRLLERRPELVAALEERFARMGRTMVPENLRQAEAPAGAVSIPNANGTAPGVFLEHDGRRIYALPGVPGELAAMLEAFVVPREQAAGGSAFVTRTVRTAGIGESDLARRIAGVVEETSRSGAPRLAILASDGEVRLTLTAPVGSAADARAAELVAALQGDLGPLVYGDGAATLQGVVSAELRARRMTLAVAESLTGGLLAARIVSVPGASDLFVAGYVTYSPEAKIRDLGVPAETLSRYGVVSRETAEAMAVGARRRAGASAALSTTGEAGPNPASAPVGLVCIGLAWEGGEASWSIGPMGGDREMIRRRTCTWALNQLRVWLLNNPDAR